MTWQTEKLGAVTKNLDSHRKPLNQHERLKISQQKLYPYIGSNNIMDYIDKYIFNDEILCISEDGGSWGSGQRCANYYNQKCWVNNHAHVLSYNGSANLKFLLHYLNYADLNYAITGTTRGKLTKTALEEIKVPLPPLETQKKIADILDMVDQLRRKEQELIKKYDELAQAIFIEMFGDPVINSKGWEMKKLGDVLDSFKYGTNEKSVDNVDNGTPVLRIPNIVGNKISLDDLKFTKLSANELCLTKLQEADLLFVRTNGNPNYIGRSAVFDLDGIFSYASYLIRGRMKQPNLAYATYLQYAMSHKRYRPLILSKVTTTAGNYNINTQSLKSLPVNHPEQKNLDEFYEILLLIKKQIKLIAKNESEQLFQSLLQRAFNGELVR